MFGSLKGIIDFIGDDHVIIDVGGVGYIVHCASSSLGRIGQVGDNVKLYIETVIREDAFNLYGFLARQELYLFKELIKVNGIGSKAALAVISVMTFDEVMHAIITQNKAAFKNVAGVGPKLAMRLITELKDKFKPDSLVGKIDIGQTNGQSDGQAGNMASNGNVKAGGISGSNIAQDAISALVNLGYNYDTAYKITYDLIQENQDITVSELIKLSLKELVAN
ncbi:MAG: Holliday junction branch migration protein RuvA [Pseudomonadota bacterium]